MADPLYTVDADGITVAPLSEVLTSIQDGVEAAPELGPDWDTSEDTSVGQLLGIVAEPGSQGLALASILAAYHDPDAASGVALDAVASLTGTIRSPATRSQVAVLLTGVDTSPVPEGRTIRHTVTDTLWRTTEDVVIGPAGVATTIETLDVGPVHAAPSSDWEIATGAAGWTGVTSTADVVPGQLVETDEELRVRRKAELSVSGTTSNPGAVSSLVTDVTEITEAAIFENFESVTVNGIDPQSVEVLIVDGGALANDAVASAIHVVLPAGTKTSGLLSGTHVDAASRSFAYKFSRPVQVPFYVRIAVTLGAVTPPEDWTDIVKGAVVDGGNTLGRGSTVTPGELVAPVWTAMPNGTLVSVSVTISLDGAVYVSTPITVLPRESPSFALVRAEIV